MPTERHKNIATFWVDIPRPVKQAELKLTLPPVTYRALDALAVATQFGKQERLIPGIK
jgi:hypothetical protein